MIGKNLICKYCISSTCTYSTPDPDGLFDIVGGGCRAGGCTGYQPAHKAKISTPIAKIETCHTPLTVAGVGPDVKYYVFDGAVPAFSTDEQQYPSSSGRANINLLAEYYDKDNYPPMLSLNRALREKWACTATGWFMPQSTGEHNFYVAGDGNVQLTVNSVTHSDTNTRVNDSEYKSFAVTLTSGSWVPFSLQYYQTSVDKGGYVAMFDHPNDSTKLPLSAGTCTGSGHTLQVGEMPYSWSTVSSVTECDVDEALKESSVLTFSLPFVPSGQTGGYYYDQSSERLMANDGSVYLRKGELVRCSMGFRSNGVEDLVKKFVGHITDFGVRMTIDGNRTLEVVCEDFRRLTNDVVSLNYPSIMDYWMAGFIDNDRTTDGVKKGTPAYDAWPAADVYRTLLIRAGVDPVLFAKRYEAINYDYDSSMTSEYLVAPVSGVDKFPQVRLDRTVQYGNPNSETEGGEADSEYHFQFGFGEKVADIINELADNYGFMWGFRGYSDGAPYLATINTPSHYQSPVSWSASEWSDSYDINAIGTQYYTARSSGVSFSFTVTGVAAEIVCPTYSGLDSGIDHVSVLVKHGAITLSDTSYNHYYSKNRQFYEGIDPATATNPTRITIFSGYRYGAYTVTVTALASGVRFNSILSYQKDYLTPSDSVTSFRDVGDPESSPGNVIEFDYDDSLSDMRNDVVVIGRSKGKTAQATEFNEPEYYYAGRGVDVESIYNPSSVNYVGRYKSGMVVSNKIGNDERAGFIAYSVLSRLRRPGKGIELQVQGHPLLELNDAFTVVHSGFISDCRWVESISTKYSKDQGLITDIGSRDYEPYGSYIRRPYASVSGNMARGISIYNGGCLTTLTSAYINGDATMSVGSTNGVFTLPTSAASSNLFANAYIIYPNSNTQWNYSNMVPFVISGYDSSSLSIWRAGFAPMPSAGTEVLIPYDPYYSEQDPKAFVTIGFDVLRDSRVSVKIVSEGGFVVADLLGEPDSNHDQEKTSAILGPGRYYVYWDGIDQYGQYNEASDSLPFIDSTESEDIVSGKPGAGMYVTEKTDRVNAQNSDVFYSSATFGKFYVRIVLEDIYTGELQTISSNALATDENPDAPSSDWPIYTKRSAPCFDVARVHYSGHQVKVDGSYIDGSFYGGEGWAGTDASYMQGKVICDTAHDGKGLRVEFSDVSSDSPQRVRSLQYYESGWMIIRPRLMTYKIQPTYRRIAAVLVGKEEDENVHLAFVGWLSTYNSPVVFDGSNVTSSTEYIRPDANGHMIYNSIPELSAEVREVVQDTSRSNIIPAPNRRTYCGLQVWGWLLTPFVTVEDLSGRQLQQKHHFNWLGQNTVTGAGRGEYIKFLIHDPDYVFTDQTITAPDGSTIYFRDLNASSSNGFIDDVVNVFGRTDLWDHPVDSIRLSMGNRDWRWLSDDRPDRYEAGAPILQGKKSGSI